MMTMKGKAYAVKFDDPNRIEYVFAVDLHTALVYARARYGYKSVKEVYCVSEEAVA